MVAILAASLLAGGLFKASYVTVTVDSGPRQTFQGMGASIASETSTGWTTPATRQQMDLMASKIWGLNHFTSARLWMSPQIFEPVWGTTNMDDYLTAFVSTNRVGAAIRAGAKDLVLAPSDFPAYMDDGTGRFSDAWIPSYGALLADFIYQFKKKTGWLINWTGVLNEPTSGKHPKIRNTQWPLMIKSLRAALDARGLTTVRILAPETATADAGAYDVGGILLALAADPVAWSQFDAIATHSYGLCANPQVLALAKGKPWWVTESGSFIEQNEVPGDAIQGTTAATRFLNDMNNGVNHWQFFIGTEYGTNVNSSNIMYYAADPYRLTILQKYYDLGQLSSTFDIGSVFRHCYSSLDGQAVFRSGKKPRITTAFAQNPDGSYSVGITNFTSDVFVSPFQWLQSNGGDTLDNETYMLEEGGYAATTFNVTLVVPELANVPSKTFAAYRTNASGPATLLGTYKMTNGVLPVWRIGPLDLITLRSTN